jgi:hypothetical protein
MVLLSRLTQCPFAVKGGGHAAFGGASSIDGGITVSMENFKKVVVSDDKTTADIGPGNTWVDVYTELEKSGVGVVGGRVRVYRRPLFILCLLTRYRWRRWAFLVSFLAEASLSSLTNLVGLATT